jgi:DNA modification methylase
VAELVAAEPDEPWLLWCDTDYEADALLAAVPGSVEVSGSMTDKLKEDRLLGFAEGRYRILIGKPSQCGYGLNYQHCARMAFIGVSYSWEQFFQAVRRCWRFGQTRPVDCHVVCAETETETIDTLKRKQGDNDRMKAAMLDASREHWREYQEGRVLTSDYESRIERGEGWELRLGDCCQEAKKIAANSVGFSIHSPPFSNLYIYSDSVYDMGNSADDDEFMKHYAFLIQELHRVTIPGRLAAVHCKDLPKYRNRDGACGLKDFPGEIVRQYEACGWVFHSRITIWKCPVTEMERTKNNGLLHKTVCRDSSQVRQGMADYLLVFRKNPTGDNLSDEPIVRPNGFESWPGDPAFDPRVTEYHPSKYARKGRGKRMTPTLEMVDVSKSIQIWQRLADPVWWHIDQQDVLNYELGKGDKDEKHICPLQLGVIREAVELWTNPGDVVFSPFAGIGSEGYESVRMGRRFVGIELKESYFLRAVENLRRSEKEARQKDLFADVEA